MSEETTNEESPDLAKQLADEKAAHLVTIGQLTTTADLLTAANKTIATHEAALLAAAKEAEYQAEVTKALEASYKTQLADTAEKSGKQIADLNAALAERSGVVAQAAKILDNIASIVPAASDLISGKLNEIVEAAKFLDPKAAAAKEAELTAQIEALRARTKQ